MSQEITMSAVNLARDDARKQLLSTARQSVRYVGYGQVMKRELAEKYNLPEDVVGAHLHEIINEICRNIQ